jgi:hypothetical protein
MKYFMTVILAIIAIVIMSVTAQSGWLIFHKPAFAGKVIDAETKEPIEGAVVVVVYRTHTILGGPAGGWSTDIEVKETLTDKSGEFSFSSYTTLMNPNATDFYTIFIIYKPGYGSFPGFQVSPPPPYVGHESHFSERRGERIEFQRDAKTVTFTAGTIELPRLKTKEERLRTVPGKPMDFGSNKLPLFYKAINDEYQRFKVSEVE